MSNTDRTAKNKLAALMADVQPVIDRHLENLEPSEVEYILTNFRSYLKIDLERDLEKKREHTLTTSPFDELIREYNDKD